MGIFDGTKRKVALKSLKDALNNFADGAEQRFEFLSSNHPEDIQNKKRMGSSSANSMPIDNLDLLTTEDLQSLSSEFNRIHNIGLEYDIRVDIDGLDRMPCKAVSSAIFIFPAGQSGIIVTYHHQQPYEILRHPLNDGEGDTIEALESMRGFAFNSDDQTRALLRSNLNLVKPEMPPSRDWRGQPPAGKEPRAERKPGKGRHL